MFYNRSDPKKTSKYFSDKKHSDVDSRVSLVIEI